MTEITQDHIEWAVVDRLRLMLEEPSHQAFNVTEAYSHFSSVLCWVIQRLRKNDIVSNVDKRAHDLFKKLEVAQINVDPWRIQVPPVERIERFGKTVVRVPAPQGFETHTAERLLINLRDATAHGDARVVEPFNSASGRLVGFTFSCAEFKDRKRTWSGKITLTEADMRRIGIQLAKLYCDAIQQGEPHRHDGRFRTDAASIKEVVA